jgi:acetylornithine deacetylase
MVSVLQSSNDVISMIERLVAFDTTSHLSNLPLIDFVAEYLKSHGVESTIVPTPDKRKAALYATIGPQDQGGIVLSGHSDVVPVEGQAWSGDPFKLTARDGRLYGRGSCDMKSFVGICLSLVPEMIQAQPKIPIHLALSYDEEVGCVGVRPLIDHIVEHFPQPKAVIVGEPTNMTVVNAHKSINVFVTEVTGHEAHSSMDHLGVNAIMVAGELICELNRIGQTMRDRGDSENRFDPPYTSVHVGTIAGGSALNIVPKSCRFKWEYRGIPGQDDDEIPGLLDDYAKTLLPAMHAVDTATGIETTRVNDVPVFSTAQGGPAELLALKLARQNDKFAVSYGTEAGLFEGADMPSIVCGPGDIEQAHKPDEFVTLDQIERCIGFIRRLIDEVR